MKVRFWGVRGSIPTPWKEAMEVGGNTSCVQIVPSTQTLIILDAGTGIRLLGNDLIHKQQAEHLTGHIFLSHTHWDHIQGFPFFSPAFIASNHFKIYGASKAEERLEDVLKGQMNYQYFPVQLDQMGARIEFVELQEETIELEPGLKISSRAFNHPGGVYGFRIEHEGYSLVYATDMEYTLESLDERLLEFARGVDLFIYDAQYTPEELKTKTGWGHSTHTAAAHFARMAGVKRLMLYHHDPLHSDQMLLQMEQEARAIFPQTWLAKESLEIDLQSL